MATQCRSCGTAKPDSEFYARSDRPGVLRSHCKACMQAYVDRNRERIRARQREWARNHPDSAARSYRANQSAVTSRAVAWQRRSRADHPELWRERSRASQALHRALKRGALTRPASCEECGVVGPIEGAHHDYSRPLDVRWLCRRCHRRWDKAEPKLLRGA